MIRAPLLVAAVACSSDKPPVNTPPAVKVGEWRCFVADPKTPVLPQGNVTHSKERLIDDAFENANVNIVKGVHGSFRGRFVRVSGTRFEQDYLRGKLVLELRRPDATSYTIRFDDPDSDWWFAEDVVIDATGETTISTDPTGEGSAVEHTTTRMINAPCDVVDAELAKHPG
jgi:hypothetical protein